MRKKTEKLEKETDSATCKDCLLYPSSCAIKFIDAQSPSGMFYRPLRKSFRCSLFEPRERLDGIKQPSGIFTDKVCATCYKCYSSRCPHWSPVVGHAKHITGCGDWEGIYSPDRGYLKDAIEHVQEELKEILGREYVGQTERRIT